MQIGDQPSHVHLHSLICTPAEASPPNLDQQPQPDVLLTLEHICCYRAIAIEEHGQTSRIGRFSSTWVWGCRPGPDNQRNRASRFGAAAGTSTLAAVPRRCLCSVDRYRRTGTRPEGAQQLGGVNDNPIDLPMALSNWPANIHSWARQRIYAPNGNIKVHPVSARCIDNTDDNKTCLRQVRALLPPVPPANRR